MAVQVLAGMWKRNGSSVLYQAIAYQYKYPREIMYDKDIVMLQVRDEGMKGRGRGGRGGGSGGGGGSKP